MESNRLIIAAAALGLALAVAGCDRDEPGDATYTTPDSTGTTGTTGTTDPATGTTTPGTMDPATGSTTPGTMGDGTTGTTPGTTDPTGTGGSTSGGSDQTVPPPDQDQDMTPDTTEPDTGANPGG